MSDTPAGVVDLLGVLAYAELSGFLRLAEDAARLAPTLTDRAALSEVAANEYRHFRLLRDRLEALGADPEAAMAPFVPALDAWHEQTRPSDWHEALVKAYVGTGLADDFYRAMARGTEPSVAALVEEVLEDEARSEFAVDRVRAAVEADPALGGRLALWGRRLVGEALSQAHRVATSRPELATLVSPDDLAGIGRMFAQLTEEHNQRMATLKL